MDEEPSRSTHDSALLAAAWSLVVAASWAVVALTLFAMLIWGVEAARGLTNLDLVTSVLCQAAAFLTTLAAMVLVEDRGALGRGLPRVVPLSGVLALRRAPWLSCLFAAIAGAALQLPCQRIEQAIELHWPRSASELDARAAALAAPTLTGKIALFLAAAALGPLIEELFFRGALYRSLRRKVATSTAVVASAVLFAATHLDARFFLDALIVGLVFAYARTTVGALWPGLAMHAAFNGVAMLEAFATGEVEASATDPPLPWTWTLTGTAMASLAVMGLALVARRSAASQAARAADRAFAADRAIGGRPPRK